MSRPWTPPVPTETGGLRLTVKRACEVCGRQLGDITQEELEAAVTGAPLPPVADECGCAHTIEQLALMANAVDHAENSTILWPGLDDTGRESYLRDARITLRAIIHLGYLPNGAPSDVHPTIHPSLAALAADAVSG